MRRLQALLIAAGLVMTSGAVAGPSQTVDNVDKVEFSMATSKGRLGVMVIGLNDELRKHFGASDDRGMLVARVEPKSLAARAGVQVGDVLVEVKGEPIRDASDVLSALSSVKKGDKITVNVIRDKQPVALTGTLDADATSFLDPAFGLKWFRELLAPLATKQDPRT